MAKDIDQTIYLKDYTPPAYLIDKTELVSMSKTENSTVKSSVYCCLKIKERYAKSVRVKKKINLLKD